MFCVLAFTVISYSTTVCTTRDAPKRTEYDHLRMPIHGSIFKGMLYGYFDDQRERGAGPVDLYGVRLGKVAKEHWHIYPLQVAGKNYRHHVGYGALWFANDSSFLNRWDFLNIQEIADSYLKPTDALGRNMIISGIPLNSLFMKYPNAKSVAFDSVPTATDTCKTFFLTRKEKKIESWNSKGTVYQKAGPFDVHVELTKYETLDSAFTDDFYAFVRKNEYYFVTESGKLYHAPPPKKGDTSRKMKELWGDAKRPIVAVIEDADNDKVWLFVKDKNEGAKMDLYFEMSDTIKTISFDPAKLRPVDVPGRAKMLLEYLPLISKVEKK